MNVTDFSANSQAQFNEFSESQKKLTELWSESQKQFNESQKKLVQVWMDNFLGKASPADIAASFETLLTIQQEMINSNLNAQKTALQLAIETQKHLWDSYFQLTHKMTQATSK